MNPVNRFNHASLVATVTRTDRPKSVRNRCVIEVFIAFLCCHVAFIFVCGCRGFCHRTESGIFIFLIKNPALNVECAQLKNINNFTFNLFLHIHTPDSRMLVKIAFRACSSYECFILRAVRLSNKLLRQGYVKERLRSPLRKCYGRYGDLIKHYEVPLSLILHDILDDDYIK